MKKELTFEEWEEMGALTKEIRDKHFDLLPLLTALPKKDYWKDFNQFQKYFDKMRSHLDDMVLNQFPEKDEATKVFYGTQTRYTMCNKSPEGSFAKSISDTIERLGDINQ